MWREGDRGDDFKHCEADGLLVEAVAVARRAESVCRRLVRVRVLRVVQLAAVAHEEEKDEEEQEKREEKEAESMHGAKEDLKPDDGDRPFLAMARERERDFILAYYSRYC